MSCNLEDLTAAARAKKREAAAARMEVEARVVEEELRKTIGEDAFACLGKTWHEDGAVCFTVRQASPWGLFGLTRTLAVWAEPGGVLYNPFGRKPGTLVVERRWLAGNGLVGTAFANTDEFLLAVDRLR